MNCQGCGAECKGQWCISCINSKDYLDDYPILREVLDKGSIDQLTRGASASNMTRLLVTCQKCGIQSSVKLISLLKQIRRNKKKQESFSYHCFKCSKIGEHGINLEYFGDIIDKEKTIEKFGFLPKNVKKDYVIAICECCKKSFDVKLGSIYHQARRHKQQGRDTKYKCFDCGVKGSI